MFRKPTLALALLTAGCEVPFDVTTTKSTIPTVTTTPNPTTPAADRCDDPAYGDGVCDLDLPCAAPDLDCFVLFDTDEEAAEWYAAFEALSAQQQGREPRALLSSDDPRWNRTRELLDRGWGVYSERLPVGDLRDRHPALVLIEDPAVNAFVAPDLETGNAGFAVMVQTGAADLLDDDSMALGLMMHELEHAVGLHVVGDTQDRLRTFYLADGAEPLGFEQVDHPAARAHGEAWRDQGSAAGPFADPHLGGLPLGGLFGDLFGAALTRQVAADPTGCSDPLAAHDALMADIVAELDPVAAQLDVPPELAFRIAPVLADLRDRCMTTPPTDFVGAIAEVLGISPDAFRAGLDAESLALVEGEHLVDGMSGLLGAMREDMRQTEVAFETEIGLPWDTLRYYSFEEAADDISVPILASAGLRAHGLGDFFLEVLGDDERAECTALLFTETPPYGGDLTDEHHATCWRIGHVDQVAVDPDRVLADRDILRRTALAAGPRPLGVPSDSVRRRWLADRIAR
jgi:hypothetical protein